MRSSLIKDTFFYSLANWGGRFVAFIVVPISIRYFTPEETGLFNLINISVQFLMSIALLGVIDQGLPFFFMNTDIFVEKKQYASSGFALSIVGIVITAILVILCTPLVGFIFEDVNTPLIFTFLISITLLSKCYTYVTSNLLKWSFQSPLFTKITLTQTVVIGLFSIIGIIYFNWRVVEVLVCTSIISLMAGIWAHHSVKTYTDYKYASKEKIIEMFRYSWPLLGMNVSSTLMRFIDRFFIGNINGMYDVGVFSVASNVSSVFEVLFSGFFIAWGPFLLTTYQDEKSPQKYSEYYSIFVTIGLIFIVFLGFWGEPLIKLVRPSGEYSNIGIYIPWILAGSIFYYIGGYFTPGPYLKKKNHLKLYTTIGGAFLNMILNYFLIRAMGILGACIATFIAMAFVTIANQIISNKLYFIPNRWKLSAFLIFVSCFLVSLFQYKGFAFNIIQYGIITRVVITIILSSILIIPFIVELRQSKMIKPLIGMIIDKFRKG